MANYNPNLVKMHHAYTFEELAAVFGVHKNTVANWVKDGLPCLKDRRPFLILGKDARWYLQEKRSAKKQKCKPGELFCFRCKKPTRPAANFVEYSPISDTRGRLVGICERCDCIVNMFVNHDSLESYSAIFDLAK
jgi:hypothetical protein